MKFNKFIPLLFTLAILGCTSGTSGGTGFSQTSGAVINDFSFDANQVDDAAGQTVLTLTYQNVGGKTMSGNTYTYVYGAPITKTARSATSSTAPAGDDRKWLVDDSGGGVIDSSKPGVTDQRITYTDASTNFMPPDPTTGQLGMSQLHRIILEPPIQDEGMNNIPYTFEARLCYPYKTTTSSTIKAIAQNTFAPVIAKKTAAETRASAGPIQISLKAGENIRINTNNAAGAATGTATMPLVFEVRDVGGGFGTRPSTGTAAVACNPVVDKTKAGVLDVNVFIDGTQQDCAGTGSASSGTVYIRNGVGNLYCTAKFNNQNPKTQYQIVATTDYNYYVTKDATISVSHAKS